MPTYDYRCYACGHQFEVLQSITEEPLKKCPKCGGPIERLIRPGAGLIFKGSGFYATDYRKNPSDRTGGTGSKGEDRPEGKGDGDGSGKTGDDSTTKEKGNSGD